MLVGTFGSSSSSRKSSLLVPCCSTQICVSLEGFMKKTCSSSFPQTGSGARYGTARQRPPEFDGPTITSVVMLSTLGGDVVTASKWWLRRRRRRRRRLHPHSESYSEFSSFPVGRSQTIDLCNAILRPQAFATWTCHFDSPDAGMTLDQQDAERSSLISASPSDTQEAGLFAADPRSTIRGESLQGSDNDGPSK
jgi:hypothetical protein